MKKQKIIIAHRGASALAKFENTIEAFRLAIELHADMVEFDIRRTLDQKLVVFHNPDLYGKSLCTLTYQEINDITKQKGYHVPLLEEVLSFCQGKIKLDIELKETGYEKEVISLVKKYYSYSEYFIKSFHDSTVLSIKKLDKKITTGLLIGKETMYMKTRLSEYFPGKRLYQCHADFISPHYQFLTKDFLFRMKLLHIPIYVWTVNQPSLIEKLLQYPIAGIITDRPDIALNFRQQQKLRKR